LALSAPLTGSRRKIFSNLFKSLTSMSFSGEEGGDDVSLTKRGERRKRKFFHKKKKRRRRQIRTERREEGNGT
jgi:hypothetical protein